jgi:hypothetical protein
MAIRFNAAADNLVLSSGVIDHNVAYSIGFWAYISTDTNSNATFFVVSDGASGNYDWLRTQTDGVTLQARVEIGGAGTNAAGSTLSVGQWYYITIVRTAVNSLLVYVDGVLDITNTRDITGRTAATKMEFGVLGAGSRLDGRISTIKAAQTNWSAAQVVQERYTIAPRNLSSIYGWWPCFPGSGERARDYSGNGRNFTEGGTLTDEDPPPVSWGAPVIFLPFAVTAITGSLSQTLGSLTSSAAGQVEIAGAVAVTLGALTSSVAGTVDITGQGSPTLGALTSSAAGAVAIEGEASPTLEALTVSAAGGLEIQGALSQTLGALTLSATGGADAITGELSQTLGALTSSATGQLEIAGELSKSLGSLAVSATGQLEIQGQLAGTLDALTGAGAGQVEIQGEASPTLGALTSSAAGTLDIAGAASPTLGALTSSAAGQVAITGQGGGTLGALTLNGVGAVLIIVGIVRATVGTAKQPGLAFSSKQPELAFSSKQPSISFTEE